MEVRGDVLRELLCDFRVRYGYCYQTLLSMDGNGFYCRVFMLAVIYIYIYIYIYLYIFLFILLLCTFVRLSYYINFIYKGHMQFLTLVPNFTG